MTPAIAQRSSVTDQGIEKFRAAKIDEFSRKIDELIELCVRNGLPDAEVEIRYWLSPPTPAVRRELNLPEFILPGIPQSLPLAEREWRVQLEKLRHWQSLSAASSC